jgi:hypothetical protein
LDAGISLCRTGGSFFGSFIGASCGNNGPALSTVPAGNRRSV